MKEKNYSTELEVQSLYEGLLHQATRTDTRKTLNTIHDICKKLVANNSTPSVPIVAKLVGNQGIIISVRTIYNRRGGNNPYPRLIDAWARFSEFKSSKVSSNIDLSFQLVNDSDLVKISDPVLRHKIMIIFGQHKSLIKENNALREIQKMPLILPPGSEQERCQNEQKKPALEAYDTEVIVKFLKGNNAKGLCFDQYGALNSNKAIPRHQVLSEPGLKEAIEKLIPEKLLLTE
ncbi:gamma-mobile-trio protein GmtX [Pelagibaculum spongiae]|uniref:Uncharacterized protein n=1 Tax=Pelagibaculum spongiae TaxID=2080658 RepID=A0A2V1GR53_9GAMM|nr:gamma-mobile-trio protein GmtX [Pelagibaculum spongiae]PVZ66789.1 hypothetical protein DC094_16135 [Pelagibaculum spongiae]